MTGVVVSVMLALYWLQRSFCLCCFCSSSSQVCSVVPMSLLVQPIGSGLDFWYIGCVKVCEGHHLLCYFEDVAIFTFVGSCAKLGVE